MKKDSSEDRGWWKAKTASSEVSAMALVFQGAVEYMILL